MRASFLLLIYFLIIILVGPVLFVCWVLGLRQPLMAIGRWAMRVSRAILGIDVEVGGLDRFDHKASYVFMPNHLSFLDGPLMVMVIPQSVRVIVKKNVFGIPILGWAMRYVGCVPVDRRAGGGGIKSIEKASRLMRERGYSFLVYPEGTRSLDGKLQRFRRGGFFLAIASGTPIVPVTIKGTFELMPKGRFGAKRGTVSVEFHPPVPVDGYSEGNVAELVEKVRAAVSSGL
ncbi:MAG: 1-acyl-sn-glycerol-3-phosphate acyltransferase [Candidatus Aminicenantes bacterium]|nr:1-acyl-sn-glycerol-3-phosphate acyltransferase [Candidatus Aminicenantes bacterium]